MFLLHHSIDFLTVDDPSSFALLSGHHTVPITAELLAQHGFDLPDTALFSLSSPLVVMVQVLGFTPGLLWGNVAEDRRRLLSLIVFASGKTH